MFQIDVFRKSFCLLAMLLCCLYSHYHRRLIYEHRVLRSSTTLDFKAFFLPPSPVLTPPAIRHLKPSAHNTNFVTGNRDLVFCRQRRKRLSSIFDIEDRRQRQKSFICFPHTANFRRQLQKSSSSATKIVLCALGLRVSVDEA